MDAPRPETEIYAFGPFRLDVAERCLQRDGAVVPLRAKLFDTLVVLVRRAGRLVTREELLARVWPDAIVEEGNLSHNVSALRRALGDGEGATFIETVPRAGYRFVERVERAAIEEPPLARSHPAHATNSSAHPLDSAPADSRAVPPGCASPARRAGESDVERARRLHADGAWRESREWFTRASSASPLDGDDATCLADAAFWTGSYHELVPLLENASDAYRRAGDVAGEARVALRLAVVLLERRRSALAASHARQAERLLAREHGKTRELAELERVRGRLRWCESDWEGALACSRRAAQLAHELGDRDVEALARMEAGHSLLALARHGEALEELEIAGAIVAGSELGVPAAGVTLCGLILGWRACGRPERASEWVEASARWADAAGVAFFPGMCRVHRGEIALLRGELERAESDLARGADELASADSGTAGPAFRELGSVRLRRGDLAGAERAFTRALEFGCDPQPGLARLRAARGEHEAARRELERYLSHEGHGTRSLLDREYRGEALVALVQIALASGGADATEATRAARAAVAELDATAAATGSDYHRALADGAAGELALSERRVADALRLLRESWRRWSALGAPYEAAIVRETLGRALDADGDATRARLELEGAAAAYERLGAPRELERVRDRLRSLGADPAAAPRVVACARIVGGPTLRELVGEAAWADLTSWLGRVLTQCWREHGGTPLGSAAEARDGRYAVAFRELSSALGCVAHVQGSLREHRGRHGFAPPMRVALVEGATHERASRCDSLRRIAEEIASAEDVAEIAVVADERSLQTCDGTERLRANGTPVRLVPRGSAR